MRYLIATVSLLPLLACGPEPADLGPPSRFEPTPMSAPAHLSGDIGDMTALDAPAEVGLSSYHLEGRRLDYVELNTYVEGGSWAMLGIDFLGGIDHPDLVRGEVLRFTDAEALDRDLEGDGLVVSVVGCSDADLLDDDPMFDEHAPAVDVSLREQPEGAEILVIANFDDGTEAWGAFPVARR